MIFFAGIVFSSCNNNGKASKEVTNDSSKAINATKMNYPYTIDHPDNWEIGSPENTMVALSALKGYENGNIDESMKYFGDSVHLLFDGMEARVSKDSLRSMFTKSRGSLKSLEIKMGDWESVISKDKKDEYVTLWYKQKWEDIKGNKDSLSIENDIKIKSGKIIELDEKSRKYH